VGEVRWGNRQRERDVHAAPDKPKTIQKESVKYAYTLIKSTKLPQTFTHMGMYGSIFYIRLYIQIYHYIIKRSPIASTTIAV